MANYGVLVVECQGCYQIIAEVDSRSEALEMAANYLSKAGPSENCLAPDAFVVNRRDARGWFTVREVLADQDVNDAQDLLAEIAGVEKSLRRTSFRSDKYETLFNSLEVLNARWASLGGAR